MNEDYKEDGGGVNYATEILMQLKQTNNKQWITIIILVTVIFISNMAWLYVFQSYDYSSSVEATGVYTAVDQSGNIITQDVSNEQWEMFMGWLNGESQGGENQNQKE